MFTRVDHVGVAVPDLEEALAFYDRTFTLRSVHVEVNEQQGVREAMLAVGDGTTRIQLLCPVSAESAVARFLDRSGPGLHHIAYRVDDIAAATTQLAETGVHMLYEAPRRGTAGSLINFVHPRDAEGVLVELVEAAP